MHMSTYVYISHPAGACNYTQADSIVATKLQNGVGAGFSRRVCTRCVVYVTHARNTAPRCGVDFIARRVGQAQQPEGRQARGCLGGAPVDGGAMTPEGRW